MSDMKYAFQHKTVDEMAKEANRLYRENMDDDSEMTLAEAIEYDAEGGYDYYEDEEVPLIYELVHLDGDEKPYIKYVEGDFDDGTSYVAELWCEDDATFVTYYFSTENLENDENAIENYLIKVGRLQAGDEHRLKITEKTIPARACNRLVDVEIYSVTVLVSNADKTFCSALL